MVKQPVRIQVNIRFESFRLLIAGVLSALLDVGASFRCTGATVCYAEASVPRNDRQQPAYHVAP